MYSIFPFFQVRNDLIFLRVFISSAHMIPSSGKSNAPAFRFRAQGRFIFIRKNAGVFYSTG